MDASIIERGTDLRRRRFLAVTAMTPAALQFGLLAPASVQAAKPQLPHVKPGTNVSFAPLKQIDAGVLRVAYAEAGPVSGSPVVLIDPSSARRANGMKLDYVPHRGVAIENPNEPPGVEQIDVLQLQAPAGAKTLVTGDLSTAAKVSSL